MIKEEKEKVINELAASLSKSTIVIATDFRGLPANEMVKLRRQLDSIGAEYRVAKNTLAKFAAEKAGKKQLEPLLLGPLAIVFGFDDVVKPAKALKEHIRVTGSMLKIKGGILGDRLLSAAEVDALASMPSKDILIAQLMGQLKAPIQSLHNVLSAPIRGLVNVLHARGRQLEGGAPKAGG